MELRIRGCHPYRWTFQTILLALPGSAGPRSLATTSGVSVDFLSSGYLDVSVPRVRFKTPMYSGLRYLDYPADSHFARPRSDNNRISGGFPHSEIHGSKPIPGSPWLIAGYHVLHRLLLPRHPPNALFALDLVQKEQDALPVPEVILSQSMSAGSQDMPVSVLDLEQYRLRGHMPQVPPHAEEPAILMFSL